MPKANLKIVELPDDEQLDVTELRTFDDILRAFARPTTKTKYPGLTKDTDLLTYFEDILGRDAKWLQEHAFRDSRGKLRWPKPEMIKIKDLVVNQKRLQRASKRELMIEIAEKFNPAKFGAVTVVRIAGYNLVTDGQQRTGGARLRLDPEEEVPCMVSSMSLKEAAETFLDINVVRRAVGRAAKQRVGVTAGDSWSLRVQRFLEQEKLYFHEDRNTHKMFPADYTGITGAKYIEEMLFSHDREPNLYPDPHRILSIYRQVFPGKWKDQFTGGSLKGVFLLLYMFPDVAALPDRTIVKCLTRIAKGSDTVSSEENLVVAPGGTPQHIAKEIAQQWHKRYKLTPALVKLEGRGSKKRIGDFIGKLVNELGPRKVERWNG